MDKSPAIAGGEFYATMPPGIHWKRGIGVFF
jgi:hypothetical protein